MVPRRGVYAAIRNVFLITIIYLNVMFAIGCVGIERSESSSHERGGMLSRGPWKSIQAGIEVVFQAQGNDSAFYRIKANGKSWRVQAPVYHPERKGVDGLRMREYADQKVYISPNGRHVAIAENAGGEDVAHLLVSRIGEEWIAQLVAPKAHLYSEGRLQPGSVMDGLDNERVYFSGEPVRFDDLKIYRSQKIESE